MRFLGNIVDRSQYYNSNNQYDIKTPVKKLSYKFLLIIIFIIGFLIYLMEFSTIGNYIQHIEIYNGNRYYDINDENHNVDDNLNAYFVNTIGCKMPSFPTLDKTIEQFIEEPEPIFCRIPLTASNNKYLWIHLGLDDMNLYYNISNVDLLKCYYEPFKRFTDNKSKYYGPHKNFKYGQKVLIKDEFIKVVCDYGNYTEIYHDYHVFVPNKEKKFNPNINNENEMKFNVMVLGLDSLSRLNFRRQLSKSYDLLKTKLKAFEFFGYNKVDDNTYPNLVPVLTGFDKKELFDACLSDKDDVPYDGCHFIWKSFAESGYYTVFSEDIGYLGLFNYFRAGFKKQPTDFYTRPLFLEMENNIASNKKLNVFLCLGGKRPVDYIFEYINKFVETMKNLPYFSFFWSSSMTHDYLNTASLIDNDLYDFLLNLYEREYLNNTILFLMSDHGIRWGSFRNTYQGMMEERQPALFLVFPENFYYKFSLAINNLNQNQRRLTTHFDLYETFKDLINTTILTNDLLKLRANELVQLEPKPKGISLFLPIPKTRTCETSGIDTHWCTCHEKETISTIDTKVQISARFIVKNINQMLQKYPQCQTLYLMSIKEATLGRTNANITKNILTKKFHDITVRLITKPGFGEFEGTVRLDPTKININSKTIINFDETSLTGTISRTNLYGKQSYCVDDYIMKLYCYCGR